MLNADPVSYDCCYGDFSTLQSESAPPFVDSVAMDTTSVKSGAAILDCSNVDVILPAHAPDDSPIPSEFDSSKDVYIVTPQIEGIPSVVVYAECVVGTCDCVHLIGGVPSQLKPCRAASFLFGDRALDSILTDDRLFLWRGLVCGFDIVDKDCQTSYQCSNYDSILSKEFYSDVGSTVQGII